MLCFSLFIIRYLYNALWQPEVTERDRYRYRDAANQIQQLLVYKTRTADSTSNVRLSGVKGMPKLIIKRMERICALRKRRKEDLKDGVKVLSPGKTPEEKLKEKREKTLKKKVALQKMIRK